MKKRLDDLVCVPAVSIIKGLLVRPKNCMFPRRHHVSLQHSPTLVVFVTSFLNAIAILGNCSMVGGQHVFPTVCLHATTQENKKVDPLRWQLVFECMVLKWDTPCEYGNVWLVANNYSILRNSDIFE